MNEPQRIAALLNNARSDMRAEFKRVRDEQRAVSGTNADRTSLEVYMAARAEARKHFKDILESNADYLLDLANAFAESDQDVSPCGMCSRPVLCIPDGLPCCAACAEKESKR